MFNRAIVLPGSYFRATLFPEKAVGQMCLSPGCLPEGKGGAVPSQTFFVAVCSSPHMVYLNPSPLSISSYCLHEIFLVTPCLQPHPKLKAVSFLWAPTKVSPNPLWQPLFTYSLLPVYSPLFSGNPASTLFLSHSPWAKAPHVEMTPLLAHEEQNAHPSCYL